MLRYRLYLNIVAVDFLHERDVRVVLEHILPTLSEYFVDVDVDVDVGVNLGQKLGSILSIDPDRDYLGFEPQVAACFYVQSLIRNNDIARAKVLPVGLSDLNGTRNSGPSVRPMTSEA